MYVPPISSKKATVGFGLFRETRKRNSSRKEKDFCIISASRSRKDLTCFTHSNSSYSLKATLTCKRYNPFHITVPKITPARQLQIKILNLPKTFPKKRRHTNLGLDSNYELNRLLVPEKGLKKVREHPWGVQGRGWCQENLCESICSYFPWCIARVWGEVSAASCGQGKGKADYQ